MLIPESADQELEPGCTKKCETCFHQILEGMGEHACDADSPRLTVQKDDSIVCNSYRPHPCPTSKEG